MSSVDAFPIAFVGGVFSLLIGKLVFHYINRKQV